MAAMAAVGVMERGVVVRGVVREAVVTVEAARAAAMVEAWVVAMAAEVVTAAAAGRVA